MKTFKVTVYGREVELYCKRFTYTAFGNTMVQLYEVESQVFPMSGLPYCALSTNPSFALPQGMFFSCANNYGTILEKMIDLNMIKLGESVWRSGFNTYNSFTINEEVFKQYEKECL